MALLMWQLSLILVLSAPTQSIGHDLPSLAIYSCSVMRPAYFHFFAFYLPHISNKQTQKEKRDPVCSAIWP